MAEEKQPFSPEKDNQLYTKKTLTALSLISEIGVSMAMNVAVGFFIGMYLDRWLGTTFIFLLIGIIVGILSGFRMVYLLLMRVIGSGGDKDG